MASAATTARIRPNCSTAAPRSTTTPFAWTTSSTRTSDSTDPTRDTDFKNLAPAFNLAGTTPTYRFATLGVGYGLSERAKLNVSYTYTDVKGESFEPTGPDYLGRYKGGLLTTQLTVKF